MGGKNRKVFWGPEILYWTLIIFVLLFCVYIAIPNYIGGGHGSPANTCINNLRQIDAAANQFALEHNKTNGEAIKFPDDLTPYIKLTREDKISPCPFGGIYHISKVGEAPTCSLSNTVSPAHVLP
jgi:hypothetical protein